MADDFGAALVPTAVAAPDSADTGAALVPAAPPSPQAAPSPSAPVSQEPINVINPSGELVSIPHTHLEEAISNGYQVATPEQVDHHFKEEKYGGLEQQAKAAVEGFAEANTFGLSTGLETNMGLATPEDIAGRREIGPGHTIGEVAGLFTPGGLEAKALGAAGHAASGLVQGAGILSKIGSMAARGAVETALVQSGSEVSKMFSDESDPNHPVQTALTNIGLYGLLGGGGLGAALGTVSPLWKAAMGGKMGSLLGEVATKVGGIDSPIPSRMAENLEKSGLAEKVKPEVKALLSDNPYVQHIGKTLEQSDTTTSGIDLQKSLKEFRSSAADSAVEALGKTPDEVQGLTELSEHAAGSKIQSDLSDQLKTDYAPIKKSYEEISNKFKAAPLSQVDRGLMGEKIAALANDGASAESAEGKLIQRVLKEVQGQTNLEQLRKYNSALQRETSGIAKQELWGVARKLRGIIGETEESVLGREVADKAPELIEKYNSTKTAYKDLKNTISDLNDRLHVGAHGGPETFISALKDMDPESVLRRLSPKGKADLIAELSTKFPQVAGQVRDFELSKILKGAASKAGPDQIINPNHLFNSIEKLSPEMRDFVAPAASQEKLTAVKELLEHFEKLSHNFSNTARTADKLFEHIPGSVVAMTTMAAGHNPLLAGVLGALTKTIGKDIPDAVRLGFLKFLGSGQNIEPTAFKAMVEYMDHTIKGEKLTGKAIKNIFRGAIDVLPSTQVPSAKDREKLDKKLKDLQSNGASLQDIGGDASHYLPNHAAAMGQTAANAVTYLNSIRPGTAQARPLDSKMPVDPWAQAKFNRALDIAQQPLMVLEHIKKGTIQSGDVVTLSKLYPALYSQLSQRLMEHVTDMSAKDEPVPYKTRMALSVFLGQPLDSTLNPSSIIAAQPQPKQQNPEQSQAPVKHSNAALNKIAPSYRTPEQARAQRDLKT